VRFLYMRRRILLAAFSLTPNAARVARFLHRRKRILLAAAAAFPVIVVLASVAVAGFALRLRWIQTHRRAGEVGCPACGSSDLRDSLPGGPLDRILGWCLCMPFRCRKCHERFYLYVQRKAG
jgi:hypothetical protein